MYTYFAGAGRIIRDADGVQVAPTSNPESQDYTDYLAWCADGNAPKLGEEPAVDPATRILTKLEFRRRFTMSERITLDAAVAGLNPLLPAEVVAGLRTMQKDLELAEQIDLDDADVIYGLGVLEQIGLIAAGRADEIRA